MVLTAAMIATATGGTLLSGSPATAIDGFSIDSRSLQPGDLFFAIVAARDGHDFVADAIARGAAGAVVAARLQRGRRPVQRPAAVVIQVADTTRALQDLGALRAARVRRDGGRHHRQRRQDDDEGDDRGVAVGPLHGREEPRQPEQPPRAAAVAARAASRRRRRGDGARHEPRRRDSPSRRASPSPRCACGPTSATRISATSHRRTRSPTPRPKILDERVGRPTCSSATPTIRSSWRAHRRFAGRVDHLRRRRARRRARRRRRGPRPRRHALRARRRRTAHVDVRMPLLGRGNLSNVLAATAVAHRARRAAGRDRRARARRSRRRRIAARSSRLAKGVTVVDDSLQLEPDARSIARST